jgi:choline dehydrogenase
MMAQPGVLDWALKEWAEKGDGPLGTSVSGSGFISHSSIVPESERSSRIEWLNALLEKAPAPSHPGLAKQLQLQTDQLFNDNEADLQFNFGATGVNPGAGDDLANLFTHKDPGGYAGTVVANTHAFSRGSIHIQSNDAKVAPLIDPRYFSHPLDVELIATGLRFTQKVASTSPMADLLKDHPDGHGKILQPSFPVPPGEISQEVAVAMARAGGVTSFHPIGTCSMLPEQDGGVVDTNLKVYGLENLRVVDASVFPLHVRGNIASLVYAVAERAADLIKNESGA